MGRLLGEGRIHPGKALVPHMGPWLVAAPWPGPTYHSWPLLYRLRNSVVSYPRAEWVPVTWLTKTRKWVKRRAIKQIQCRWDFADTWSSLRLEDASTWKTRLQPGSCLLGMGSERVERWWSCRCSQALQRLQTDGGTRWVGQGTHPADTYITGSPWICTFFSWMCECLQAALLQLPSWNQAILFQGDFA